MSELTGWRRAIGHQGTFLAALELWPPERAGKVRHLQSGFGAVWSFQQGNGQGVVESGPIDLVNARSLASGSTGHVLIHPMLPEAWQEIQPGALLELLSLRSRPRVIGEATVLERRGVPASAPMNPLPFEETPARARLRAVTPTPEDERPALEPPTVTVEAAVLPLLSSHWGHTADPGTSPTSRAEEVRLAARLPDLALDRTATTVVAVGGTERPTLARVAYFSGIDADGIPCGERREVDMDGPTLLAEVDRTRDGHWCLAIPAAATAKAVIITLTFAVAPPRTSQRSATWGFRIR